MKRLILIFCLVVALSLSALAAQPVVAVHVSELTQALEGMTATPPTPTGAGTTGRQWWTPWWHYSVMSDSLKEALRSDGTPFVVVTDADIRAGNLLDPDGSPKYPIVISLASEAISDDEVTPLLNYVSSGGFLFVGSSSFTRKPGGSPRGDFAFAAAMGLHVSTSSLDNWYQNSTLSIAGTHRLVSHIPIGSLRWRMPLTSEDVPWGTSPAHPMEGDHFVWQVSATGATVIATADSSPYLTANGYGQGTIIYDAAMQPLLGLGGLAPSMYSYGIVRNAIQWAFESAGLPIVKVSPWPYAYNAAYMVRHDFENYQSSINSIEASAQAESAVGAKGDYYFCTGTLRVEMGNSPTTIASLRRAVALYGATIGSHNGGLPNPNNPSLTVGDYDYWHWGPDEALDTQPQGYANGTQYAYSSIATSFADLDGWLAGLNTNTRTWVSPYFNSTREGSMQLLDQLGVITGGEQKISPFPHWTISTQTPGKTYRYISLPTSEWYINGEVAQAIETTHNTSTIDALVDYYYDLGALVNLYSHHPSTDPDPSEYLHYVATKPAIWPANAATLFGWWTERSTVQAHPSYSIIGNRLVVTAIVTGATNPETAVEVAIPNWAVAAGGIQVRLDGALANPSSYRQYNNGIKIKVGTTVSTVEVSYPITVGPAAHDDWYAVNTGNTLNVPAPGVLSNDTAPAGTSLTAVLVSSPTNGTLTLNSNGSFTYTPVAGFAGKDHFTYLATDGVNESGIATVTITVNPAGTLFGDDFSWPTGPDPLWITVSGSWNVVNGTLQGSSPNYSYGYAYANGNWTDYSMQADVQFPAGAFGGGIGGRVNPATGAHYGAWIYPEGSPGGSSVLKLVKFHNWTTWSRTPMAQVSLPAVGTTWHTVSLTFRGNRIQIFYDGTQYIDVTDNGFDSIPAYTSGAVSVDLWTENSPFLISIDNVVVRVLGPTAQNDGYSMNQDSTLTVPVPGVLGNDTGSAGSSMVATLVNPTSHGTLNLRTDGSFTYTPSAGFIGNDSFTYQSSSAGMSSNTATVTIVINQTGVLFSDDFSGQPGFDPLWTTVLGSWNVANGIFQGSGPASTYGFVYTSGNWTDYSVQGRVQFPAGAFGGGIGGRVNSATGAHYGAWIYPEGSGGGSSVLKLIKFQNWATWGGTPMAQASLPGVETTWHTLLLMFEGSRIRVSYDGVQYIDVTDTGFDSLPAYLNGGVSLDMWTEGASYNMSIDNILVQALTSTPVAQNDSYTLGIGSTLNVSAPGVLGNDSGGGSGAMAILVAQPASGTLTLQSDGGFTYVPAVGFAGTDSFTYQASIGGLTSNTATVTITVTPPGVSSVVLNPASVSGGTPSTGTVTLSGPAPSGGATVTLTSSNTAAATVPSSVTVAANATSATFTVTTSPVASNTSLTISATYNSTTQTAGLMVTPPVIGVSGISLNPTSVQGGSSTTGTVTLNAPAPPVGAVVALTSGNTAAATVPATVTVVANTTSATFPVTTSPVASDTSVTISANYGTTTATTLTITAATLSSVSLNPTSVRGGISSTGTVTLSGPAPAAGAAVTLASSNTAAATLPASVTVAANATTATFTVTTNPVAASTPVTVSATYGANIRTASLTVTPASLSSLTVNPNSVRGGSSSTGTATLNGPAPAGGAVVSLTSSNTAVAGVPSSVTVAANATTATFTIATTPVVNNTSVTISATYGATRNATLTVTAASLSSVTVNPTSVRGGSLSTGTATLNGPAPAGGAVVTLASSNTSAATVPASVTVAPNATTASFTITTSPVASNTSVTITGTYRATRTRSLTVTAAALSSVSLSPPSVPGGTLSTGTVTLNGPAPAAGAVVSLSSNRTSVATVPASVTVAANATTATFTVTTKLVTSNTSATISAFYRGVTRRATLAVFP